MDEMKAVFVYAPRITAGFLQANYLICFMDIARAKELASRLESPSADPAQEWLHDHRN